MFENSKWITCENGDGYICPKFTKQISPLKPLESAVLHITARGVYEAEINGKRVGNFIFAPGWTTYKKRLQYQEYDITDMLAKGENLLEVTLAPGWYSGRISRTTVDNDNKFGLKHTLPVELIASVVLTYSDGTREEIVTDESWTAKESGFLFSDIYDGEIFDAAYEGKELAVIPTGSPKDNIICQEGEIIAEQERIKPLEVFKTPKGETVIDFGQNLTGYVEFTVSGKTGDEVAFSFAEVMDKDGNFYNENYRRSKCICRYICRDGVQTHKPHFVFFGFRYIRIDKFPSEINPDDFTAIVVHSDMKRTGHFKCSNPKVNKLFENIIWGQKDNFLDVPTDCPQRDERLGWTGDAQVFIKAASYNFDTRKFYKKWLHDLRAEQAENGSIPRTIPKSIDPTWNDGYRYEDSCQSSAAWGDAAVICPWQLYLSYGDKDLLRKQYESMKKWISYIGSATEEEYLWVGGFQYGDWLGLDSPQGSYKGSSRDAFIASAYYAYSTSLVIKAGKALGEDTREFEELYKKIVEKFRQTFPEYKTQTENVLALTFNLTEDKAATAKALADLIKKCGNHLETGFVGTPYILHALSENGYADVAYNLLLREEYPSWLYPVNKGATTVWEHWDGIHEDGTFWSAEMNSFNHYAYGAVADWLYGAAAGINTVDDYPGFEKILFAPIPDKRLSFLEASIITPRGEVSSRWEYIGDKVRYEITTPSPATVKIGGKTYEVEPGHYIF